MKSIISTFSYIVSQYISSSSWLVHLYSVGLFGGQTDGHTPCALTHPVLYPFRTTTRSSDKHILFHEMVQHRLSDFDQ